LGIPDDQVIAVAGEGLHAAGQFVALTQNLKESVSATGLPDTKSGVVQLDPVARVAEQIPRILKKGPQELAFTSRRRPHFTDPRAE
jgi:hypothetical protein